MIHILSPEEARKIAAGEVIDRPAALVREFMDNALDASGTLIEVSIEGGGITRAEVSDDGEGMSRDDLELCCLTHATSKITSLSDLDTAETLGFRGEALSSAAAVARLEILTSRNGAEAWKLETGPGKKTAIEQGRRTRGTSVRAIGLFDALPARKRFLKREGSEAAVCRGVFDDKALVFPQRNFRFFQDGKLKAFYPADSSYCERFGKIILEKNENEKKFIHEITAKGNGYEIIIVFGGPEIFRTDRRRQFVFANGRRIQEYSLLQAFEYGMRGWFPNGVHPVGAICVNIDPALADFNIHPAKREVRFADIGAIHHSITTVLENFRRAGSAKSVPENPLTEENLFNGRIGKLASEAFSVRETVQPYPENNLNGIHLIKNTETQRGGDAEEEREELSGTETRSSRRDSQSIKLIGRVFDLFIVVESDERLFIIDQHAAHERILYNRFMNEKIPQQELLVVISFAAETDEDDNFLAGRQSDFEKLGISLKKDGNIWHIEALPADWRLPDSETIREILNLKTAGKNMAEHWAQTLSCHSAVKDGDYLDDQSALKLAEEALNLPDPHCPHGRPIWAEISREQLLRAVRRT